jgi:diadenosine tetraphosphatase ApaH/serine/threonine PP2A family protein phosphatase
VAAAADIQRAAFAADRTGILGHALDEGDLEFERGVAGALRQHGVDRKPHRRIQQDRGIAAMHRADRIVVPETGDAVKHDDAGFGRGVKGLDGLHDRRRRQFALEDGADEIEARHRRHDIGRGYAEFDFAGGLVVHQIGSIIDF